MSGRVFRHILHQAAIRSQFSEYVLRRRCPELLSQCTRTLASQAGNKTLLDAQLPVDKVLTQKDGKWTNEDGEREKKKRQRYWHLLSLYTFGSLAASCSTILGMNLYREHFDGVECEASCEEAIDEGTVPIQEELELVDLIGTVPIEEELELVNASQNVVSKTGTSQSTNDEQSSASDKTDTTASKIDNKTEAVDEINVLSEIFDDSKEARKDMESTIHISGAGFKERKIIEYENRLRHYSTPDKLFRYFATMQDAETSIIYMTPEDFVRSLTPDTLQPIGLQLDEFRKFDKKNAQKYVSAHYGSKSVFREIFGEAGLISFTDYIFLLTVISTSAQRIDIAFKMFDINGDGEVSQAEFQKVHKIFLDMSATGNRHRDRKTTGNVLGSASISSGLDSFFFGEDGNSLLTAEQFVAFKRRLQREVMRLEFSTYKPVNGRISEKAFAEILLTYASFTGQTKKKILKRIGQVYEKDKDGNKSEKAEGITFDDYLSFLEFMINLRDVEMALSFHTIAGQAVDHETFQQVGRTVAGVTLRDHLVKVVFCIFDENDDGKLSHREFIAVMKDKLQRGLNKPKDTGFTRLLSAISTCAKQTLAESIFPGSESSKHT